MVQRIGGFRRKTRHKLKKNVKNKGKISIKNYYQTFEEGDKVHLVAEPAVQDGMFFPRFQGKSGIVKNLRGKCYVVQIKDGNKKKEVIVHPIHLRRA